MKIREAIEMLKQHDEDSDVFLYAIFSDNDDVPTAIHEATGKYPSEEQAAELAPAILNEMDLLMEPPNHYNMEMLGALEKAAAMVIKEKGL